jgi:hypothetical protein
MGCAATGTGLQPIMQGDGIIDAATDMAAFGRREGAALSCGPSAVADAGNKAVDVMDMRPVLLGSGSPDAESVQTCQSLDPPLCGPTRLIC